MTARCAAAAQQPENCCSDQYSRKILTTRTAGITAGRRPAIWGLGPFANSTA